MPLMHVFEVLLLVAIVAGSFFMRWDSTSEVDVQPADSKEHAPACD